MIEIDLGIVHHFCAGVYAKEMHLPSGHYAETHEHKYDHLSLLAEGSAYVELDDVTTVHNGPCVIEIKAGKRHRITAITKTTWFCIHPTEETDPEKVDSVLIMKEEQPCPGE